MIFFFRWLIGVLLLAVFIWLASLNAIVFWRRHVLKRSTSSWIPLLAGIAGVLSLCVIPVPQLGRWWFLPLLLDWGSVPGMVYTLEFHCYRAQHAKQSSR